MRKTPFCLFSGGKVLEFPLIGGRINRATSSPTSTTTEFEFVPASSALFPNRAETFQDPETFGDSIVRSDSFIIIIRSILVITTRHRDILLENEIYSTLRSRMSHLAISRGILQRLIGDHSISRDDLIVAIIFRSLSRTRCGAIHVFVGETGSLLRIRTSEECSPLLTLALSSRKCTRTHARYIINAS